MSKNPTIIGISGVSGGGKTTLTKALSTHFNGSTTLYFDDYADDKTYPANFSQWFADGADFNVFRSPQLATDLASLKKGNSVKSPIDGSSCEPTPLIFCEAPLGRAHHNTGQHLDYLVYIKTPLEVGLARTILRYAGNAEQIPAEALKEYINNYLASYRPTYLEQIKQIMPGADLILNGEKSVEEWVITTEAELKKAGFL